MSKMDGKRIVCVFVIIDVVSFSLQVKQAIPSHNVTSLSGPLLNMQLVFTERSFADLQRLAIS